MRSQIMNKAYPKGVLDNSMNKGNPFSGNTASKEGFTLMEVLISLTLLTIVLSSVYSSFFSVQRAIERFDDVSLKYHEIRTSLDILRREIESALLKNPQEESEEMPKAEFIVRDRDDLGKDTSSITMTSLSFRGSTLNTVTYFVKKEGEILNLFKTEGPAHIKSKGYTMEMIEGIESFTIEIKYNNKWIKTWNTANTGELPDLVRVNIEFEDNGKRIKLAEYARPMIGRNL